MWRDGDSLGLLGCGRWAGLRTAMGGSLFHDGLKATLPFPGIGSNWLLLQSFVECVVVYLGAHLHAANFQ